VVLARDELMPRRGARGKNDMMPPPLLRRVEKRCNAAKQSPLPDKHSRDRHSFAHEG
jgi:hypothetical protein